MQPIESFGARCWHQPFGEHMEVTAFPHLRDARPSSSSANWEQSANRVGSGAEMGTIGSPHFLAYCKLRVQRFMAVREMSNPLNHPVIVLLAALFIFWLSAWVGGWLRRSWPILKEADSDDLKFVIGGMLTLLALIIGFTFSMAVSRYDQRKGDEEQEASAIATALIRANQLSAADAAKIQALLKTYVDQRILFYVTSNEQELRQINSRTAELQTEMWSVTSSSVTGLPAPMAIFVLGAMNAVLDSQGYTQAAWRNRIPKGAWVLMVLISILCKY
jgi:hypothetical protein